MKPAQRGRSAAAASLPAGGATPAGDGSAGPTGTLAGLGQECYRCGLHLAEKHRPRAVSVWGLANRPMRVTMCADGAASRSATK